MAELREHLEAGGASPGEIESVLAPLRARVKALAECEGGKEDGSGRRISPSPRLAERQIDRLLGEEPTEDGLPPVHPPGPGEALPRITRVDTLGEPRVVIPRADGPFIDDETPEDRERALRGDYRSTGGVLGHGDQD